MQGTSPQSFSVAELVVEEEEDLAKFRKRRDEFDLTEVYAQALMHRIRRALEHGEPELMIVSLRG